MYPVKQKRLHFEMKRQKRLLLATQIIVDAPTNKNTILYHNVLNRRHECNHERIDIIFIWTGALIGLQRDRHTLVEEAPCLTESPAYRHGN